jgi:hypothetical protein
MCEKGFAKLSDSLKIRLQYSNNQKRLYEVHFQNGYIDMKTGNFNKRVFGKDFVTYCINRNYTKSKQKDVDYILSILKRIYNQNENDMNYVLSKLGRSLSGDVEKINSSFMLIGDGCTAKSFVLNLLMMTFQNYVKEINTKTFNTNYKNSDKTLNTFAAHYYRIAWINEMSSSNVDTDLFKNFCDGKVQTSKLWLEGSHDIELQCMLVLTSNNLLSFKVDGGMVRRIDLLEHYVRFVPEEKKHEIDNKTVFLEDRALKKKIRENENYLNAIVDIFTTKCTEWHNGKEPEITQNIKNAKDMMVSANDFFGDFVSEIFEITGKPEHCVSKNRVIELFKENYPDKHLSDTQIFNNMKQQKNVKYEWNKTCNGKKGAFVGIKKKGKDYETDKLCEYEDEIRELMEKNNNLKEEYEDNLTSLKNEYEKKIKEVIDENKICKEKYAELFEMYESLKNEKNQVTELFKNFRDEKTVLTMKDICADEEVYTDLSSDEDENEDEDEDEDEDNDEDENNNESNGNDTNDSKETVSSPNYVKQIKLKLF